MEVFAHPLPKKAVTGDGDRSQKYCAAAQIWRGTEIHDEGVPLSLTTGRGEFLVQMEALPQTHQPA